MESVDLVKENLTGINYDGTNANLPVRILTARTIIGDRVENEKGEHLGKIKDIMLDVRKGMIEYVIIEFGGFLGIGEKYFAVPFEELKIKPSKHAFILDKDKAFLKKAPGFNKDHWPETNVHYNSTDWGAFMGPNVGGM